MSKPTVITLCGSSRFHEEHTAMQARETLKGRIVIPMGFYHHTQKVPITAADKRALDKIHLRKIDISDGIFVVNPNGYIGESTRNEIAYAVFKAKGIEFMDPEAGEAYLENNAHQLGALVAKYASEGEDAVIGGE